MTEHGCDVETCGTGCDLVGGVPTRDGDICDCPDHDDEHDIGGEG